MTEAHLYSWLLYGWFALSVVTFVSLQFIAAPYGRHQRAGFGFALPPRIGWILMEAPSAIGVGLCMWVGPRSLVAWAFFLLFESHYVYRAFIFPFRLRSQKPMPFLVSLSGASFNVGNAYLIGRGITAFGRHETAWLGDPRFALGVVLFVVGFAMHLHSDEILMNLRAPGETSYKIPTGGMYRWVSCPNYLGEMIEWFGFALATWSGAGLAFALFTVANLLPRAMQNHRWYKEKFADYPPERRALVPFI
jgi:protein-S-isoprenylcysteine O-methyltransferase Ste14